MLSSTNQHANLHNYVSPTPRNYTLISSIFINSIKHGSRIAYIPKILEKSDYSLKNMKIKAPLFGFILCRMIEGVFPITTHFSAANSHVGSSSNLRFSFVKTRVLQPQPPRDACQFLKTVL